MYARTNTRARCPAQVVAKVVTQNARLSTELVEQVRRCTVGSLKPGLCLFHLACVAGQVPRGVRYADGGMLARRYGPA